MLEFCPESLLVSVLMETQKLFDYKPQLELREMDGKLLGDPTRVKYMTTCLLKNAVSRNKVGK